MEDAKYYPWVTESEEFGLHQGSHMPIEGNPGPRQACWISQYVLGNKCDGFDRTIAI